MSDSAARQLGDRASYVLRNAYIISVDPAVGDIRRGDLWVREGIIEQIGRDLDAPGAEEIDLAGTILMPGFVETHFHLWNSILRGVIARSDPARGYFPVKRRLAPLFRPDDSYRAARLALLEALESGITTVNNWNHNLRSPEDADANLQAQLDSGLRVRLSYGNPDAYDPQKMMDTADVARVADTWLPAHSDNGRIDLGVSLRGPTRTSREVMLAEWEFARSRNLPITLHVGGNRVDGDRYADLMAMHRDGLLGPDVQIVHAVDADEEELAALAATDTSLSLAWSEFGSMGIPPLEEALAAGIRVSFSIDTVAGPGSADMFTTMRMFLRMAMHRDRATPLGERDMIEIATLGGARDLRLDDVTGSLSVGKRADIIAVSGDRTHLHPGLDPAALIVNCARPDDVCFVMADGRILMRDHRIVAFDARVVRDASRRALQGILDRAEWPLGDTVGSTFG